MQGKAGGRKARATAATAFPYALYPIPYTLPFRRHTDLTLATFLCNVRPLP